MISALKRPKVNGYNAPRSCSPFVDVKLPLPRFGAITCLERQLAPRRWQTAIFKSSYHNNYHSSNVIERVISHLSGDDVTAVLGSSRRHSSPESGSDSADVTVADDVIAGQLHHFFNPE